MRIAMSLLAASLAFGSGCKKKENAGTAQVGSAGSAETGSAGSAMAGSGEGSGSATAGSGDGAGTAAEEMKRKGGNCPSLVAGSTTTAALEDGKIVLTISSTDKDAISAIQRRAAESVAEKGNGTGEGTGHDAKGTHGGGMGLCPVHLGEGGTATATNDAKGVVITITPKDKPDALKAEIDARIPKAAEWVKANVEAGDQGTTGGVGGGAGEHGSNHSGEGDSKGKERKGDGKGGGKGTGGGGGAGTGGGSETAGGAAK